MGIPTWNQAISAYPRPPHNRGKYDKATLLKEIGWDEFIDDDSYNNTCAIRMSMCLLGCGVNVSGPARMRALKGKYKGKNIAIKQDALSEYLALNWGAPVKMPIITEKEQIKAKQSLVGKAAFISYWKIDGYNVGGGVEGGHIDIIKLARVGDTTTVNQYVGSDEYFKKAKSIWYWVMS